MLSVKEVASRLGVSAGMVYDLVRSGKLVGYKVGRRVVVDESALESYLSSCKIKTPYGTNSRKGSVKKITSTGFKFFPRS